MTKFSIILALLSVNLVAATYIPRAAPGTQFITGPCDIDADCASGCCARNSGKCAGAIIALTRDGGCGHGDAQSNSRAAAVLRGNCPGTNAKRSPLSPDPAGVPHVGNGKGEQFITGQCLSNADCGSGCCATLGSIGICSGPGAADQQGKTGCGFGGSGGAPPPTGGVNNGGAAPPPAAPAGGLKPDPAGEKNVGNGKGGQFITGQCLSNADCASACCATLGSIGICSGPGAATQSGKTGCGFGGSGGAPPPTGGVNNGGAAPPPAAPAGGLKPDPAGEKNIGNGKGGQFITGQCLSNADCASACCATLGSIGICSGPGAATQSGKTGCGFGGSGGAPPPTGGVNNGGAAPAAPAGGAATSGNADIGAACGADSDCKTACCGFNSGKCALAKTAPGSDGGCGKGETTPNTKAAGIINGNAPVC